MKNKPVHKLKFFFALLLIFIGNPLCISQEYNSARLTVLYGSTIPFNFNTLERIKNGIEIVNGTKFGVTLTDNGVAGTALKGFQLNFGTFNNQVKVKGDVHEMNLDKIRVKAENALGLGAGTSEDYQTLTSSPVRLFTYIKDPWIAPVDNLKWDSHQLNISYECGKEPGHSLMGEPADYYYVEIEFELIPIGDGF
jgi:hypothetical protein